MQIKDRVFVVTGGGSGLGTATSRMLAVEGGSVVVADVNEVTGLALAAELGARARFVRCDVTSATDAEAAIATAVTTFGGLHGLANCAGIVMSEKIVGKDGPHGLDSFAHVVAVNLIGVFNMIRHAAFAMAQGAPNEAGERGVIVNTASIAAFDGQIGQAAYAASKAGLVGMTLPIARELARHGIRVVTIAPGIFETPMMGGMPREVRDELGKSVPFPPRLGKPAEFASLVKHVFDNTMLNGEVIRIDGALRMGPK
jgi:NAD(P)-dependent dehydrogenase (short-subunit alcohol dehydrogenase family)